MKLITNVIIVISIWLSIYYLYLHLIPLDISKLILGIMSIGFIILPIGLGKINKIKVEEYIKLIYYFFLLIAFILGGLFGLYYSTSLFDLLVHGLFGFLLSIIIGTKIKIDSINKIFLVLSIVLFIGFFWECLEFSSDILLKTDHQEKISGSIDTMTDLLISLLGSISYDVYSIFVNKIKK